MENAIYHMDLTVRDYECDIQGIVNNANYQHYLEHARHGFLKSRGFDFAELTAKGIILVVTRIEIDYKQPLRPADTFRVYLNLEKVGRIRYAFNQEIYRLDDQKLCIKARVLTAAMNREGRPIVPKELDALLPES